MSDDLYVQYGCGLCAPEGWRSFDSSPTLRFERIPFLGKLYTKNEIRFPANTEYGDIVKGLPIPDASCSGVYCSHVLEHLSLEDFRTALRNTYRMLKQGGVFRLVVPDLEYLTRKYMADPSSMAAATFMKETCLGKEKRERGVKGFVLQRLSNSQHLWMWDYKSLQHELAQAGFVRIRRAQLGSSAHERFAEVEEDERWDKCLGVECEKQRT